MSMSQEEIEALMNGLEVTDEEDTSSAPVDNDSGAEALSNDDIESLLAGTDAIEKEPQEVVEEDNFDDILAGIDGVVDSEPSIEEAIESTPEAVQKSPANEEQIAKDWTDAQIEQGVFPLPVDSNTKVVNQLTQVASDSEEKASKIFDVLSFVLDENNEIQKNAKELEDFLNKQIILLDSLSKKFPNIQVFKANLIAAQQLQDKPKDICARVDSENMQLFEAMELMQFHDINRQKIERVMSVIRKLSNYLNNLFEDDGQYQDVAVAKHISGDKNNELVGDDDLESLIAEFNN